MSDVSGTPRQLILDGVSFDLMADANFTEIVSAFETELTATSGRNMKKMSKRVATVEGVSIGCNGQEREVLKELAERVDSFPISYVTAGGDTYRTDGSIEFESRETETNTATLKLLPQTEWSAFVA